MLTALTVVPHLVRVVISMVDTMTGGPPTGYYSLGLLVSGAASVLALVAFHRQAPPVRPQPWLLAFGIALGVSAIVDAPFVTQNLPGRMVLDWWPGIGCIAVAVAAVLHLVGGRARRRDAESPWPLAFASSR